MTTTEQPIALTKDYAGPESQCPLHGKSEQPAAEAELKPCPNPKCGSTNVFKCHDYVTQYVYCSNCLLRGPNEAFDSTDNWNNLIREEDAAFHQGVNAAKEAIRSEIDAMRNTNENDHYYAALFINAIARRVPVHNPGRKE